MNDLETADLLHSAALHLLRHARAADAGMDLDGPRASLLSVLVFVGPRTIGQLAEAEQVSPPAITKMVTALESEGLLTRTHSANDRRMVIVTATAAGTALLRRGRAARVKRVALVLEGLPARDLATLRRAATLIEEALVEP